MQSLPCKVALLSILLAFCVNSQGLPFYFDPLGSIGGGDIHLVAWYPLNGDSMDATGNGYDGTWTVSPSYTNGVSGLSANFKGDENYILLNTISTNLFSEWAEGSFTLWAKIDGVLANQGIFSLGDSSSRRLWLYASAYYDNRNPITAQVVSVLPSSTVTLGPVNMFNISRWVHLAVTIDQSFFIIYTNGVIASSAPHSGLIKSTTGANVIGKILSHNTLTGSIDDVKIFDVSLSHSDVERVYNGLTPKY